MSLIAVTLETDIACEKDKEGVPEAEREIVLSFFNNDW